MEGARGCEHESGHATLRMGCSRAQGCVEPLGSEATEGGGSVIPTGALPTHLAPSSETQREHKERDWKYLWEPTDGFSKM